MRDKGRVDPTFPDRKFYIHFGAIGSHELSANQRFPDGDSWYRMSSS